MAGHSKWANIKHRKARQDAVRGKAWSKCSKALMAAARAGGGDPETNLTLRYAIEEAKSVNMPKDTIIKAVKKGAGELDDGQSFTEIRYEGYGPNGVAVMIDCLTDNVNRTAPEVRKIFERAGGKLGVSGSVAFGFTHVGLIVFELDSVTEDQLMEVALEAGAEDIRQADDSWEVLTAPNELLTVKDALSAASLEPVSATVTMLPENTILCKGKDAARVLRLVEELEDHDDVQKVYTNLDIPDEELEKLE